MKHSGRALLAAVLALGSAPYAVAQQAIPPDDPALIAWANHVWEALERRRHTEASATPGVSEDHLGSKPIFVREGMLWDDAQGLATAGKGSTWVYDRVHHIAGGTMCCEYRGDFIYKADPPPKRLPERDLSHIRSFRGLHVGMTIADAEARLRIPPASVHLKGIGYESMRFFKRHPPSFGGFAGTIYFKDGAATAFEVGMADS